MSTFQLLGRDVPVAPQPWTVAVDVGPRVMKAITNERGIPGIMGELYDMLVELAPETANIVARYEWLGFGSREQMDSSVASFGTGHPAPTIPEIIAACQTVLAVNGTDDIQSISGMIAKQFQKVLPGLGKLLPQLVDEKARARVRGLISFEIDKIVTAAVASEAAKLTPKSEAASSSRSPSASGESTSTSGTAESPPMASTPRVGLSRASERPSLAGTRS